MAKPEWADATEFSYLSGVHRTGRQKEMKARKSGLYCNGTLTQTFDFLAAFCNESSKTDQQKETKRAKLIGVADQLANAFGVNFQEPLLKNGISRMILPGANQTEDTGLLCFPHRNVGKNGR